MVFQVDYILTPTQLIKCEGGRPKPAGIMWSEVTRNNLRKLPVLRTLIKKEREAGNEIKLKAVPRVQRPPRSGQESEDHADEHDEAEEQSPRVRRGRGRGRRGYSGRGRGGSRSRRRQQSEQSGDEFKENSDPNAGTGIKKIILSKLYVLYI